jgi:hypothetical protein
MPAIVLCPTENRCKWVQRFLGWPGRVGRQAWPRQEPEALGLILPSHTKGTHHGSHQLCSNNGTPKGATHRAMALLAWCACAVSWHHPQSVPTRSPCTSWHAGFGHREGPKGMPHRWHCFGALPCGAGTTSRCAELDVRGPSVLFLAMGIACITLLLNLGPVTG